MEIYVLLKYSKLDALILYSYRKQYFYMHNTDQALQLQRGPHFHRQDLLSNQKARYI